MAHREKPKKARVLERELIRAGAVFVRRESSHVTYRAPNGRKFHLCLHGPHDLIGPLAQQAAWAAMTGEGSQQ